MKNQIIPWCAASLVFTVAATGYNQYQLSQIVTASEKVELLSEGKEQQRQKILGIVAKESKVKRVTSLTFADGGSLNVGDDPPVNTQFTTLYDAKSRQFAYLAVLNKRLQITHVFTDLEVKNRIQLINQGK